MPVGVSCTKLMQVTVEQLDGGVVMVRSLNDDFVAGLITARPEETVMAPHGMFCPNVSALYLRFDSVLCGMCREQVPFQCLTASGRQRAHRRVERCLTDLKFRTHVGKARILCTACGQGSSLMPKTYLSNLSQAGALDVTVTYAVKVVDAGEVVCNLSRQFVLGSQTSQKTVEGLVFQSAADAVREHFAAPAGVMDTQEPVTTEKESDIEDSSMHDGEDDP